MRTVKIAAIIGLFLLNSLVFRQKLTFSEIVFIHTFLFGIMILSEKIEYKIAKKTKNILTLFLTINIVRASLIMFFMFPIIFFSYDNKIEIILNFFIVYFLYMLIGIFYKKNQKL